MCMCERSVMVMKGENGRDQGAGADSLHTVMLWSALRGVQGSKSKSDSPDHFKDMFAKIGEHTSPKCAVLI